MTGCHDLYDEISQKYKRIEDLETDLQSNDSDPETLNKIWWVLNYHAENLDHSRRLRAIVESKLDNLAEMCQLAQTS